MSAKKTPKPPSQTRRGATAIVKRLREAGHDAFFVGGAVRDTLLGRTIREFDIATSATPDEVIASFKRTVPVGVQFGVVLVVTKDGEYEVATFRAETSYSDGRHPDDVRFVSAKEDVLRRDFTINGLLQDPEDGRIEDYVGGRADLDARIIRAIGDPALRFEEDHLRILRAIRFATTLRFDLHADTLEAIITLAPTVSTVAAERIQAELKRTFLEGDAARGYTLLALTGVLNVVLPDLGRQTDTVVCQALSQAQPKTFGEVLSILAAETPQTNAEDTVQSVSDRLRLSRDDREMFHYCMTRRAALGRDKTSLANRLRLVRQKRFNHFARVEDARRTALGLPTDELKALVRLKNAKTEEKLHPRPLLTGKDLMALGYSPGPHFKHMLLTLEDAQLEGRVSSREEAIQLVAEANSALD